MPSTYAFKNFFVWNVTRVLPTHSHGSLESAIADAKRLAVKHPGEEFLVMVPYGCAAKPPEVTFERNNEFNIPF